MDGQKPHIASMDDTGLDIVKILVKASQQLIIVKSSKNKYFCHPSSYVDKNVSIGEGTKIWHFCHIQTGASIGLGIVH